MIYYIADTHFGHANVIRFCDRPFDDVRDMDRTMTEHWNLRVTDDDDPPHPEIWIEYFLRMVDLYAHAASSVAESSASEALAASLSHLRPRERAFYERLVQDGIAEFAPVDMASVFGVSNRTIINWSAKLAECGLLEPQLIKQRIRSYKVVTG